MGRCKRSDRALWGVEIDMPDVSFSDWVAGLAVDALTGPEKIPLLDGTSSRHATAALLAAFAVDQLHQASVITTLADTDEIVAFQSDVEKILTAQNFFNWVVDKLEAIDTSTTIVSGDKLVFNDGGILKQIDIDNVKAFLDSSVTALGAEIAGLATATLADSDQYVVAQSTTAKKTTFSAIAARVHSQFLAYTAGLPAISTLADGDTFYASDSGVASKVTASTIATYVQGKVGADVVSGAWDTYSALGAAANATDVFLLERSGTGRTATGANIASYVVGTQNSAASAVATVAGDSFLIFRSGTQLKLDVGLLATYVIASGWSAASGNPVATGDKLVIGRGGTTLSVTVDQFRTFVIAGVQASSLDLTGLPVASLASGSLFLVGDGTTPKKATLAELETKLWTDYQTYVSGLTALTTLEDADTFYVIEGTTPKKITGANIASYIETEMWDKADASPAVQAGDDLWMRRSTTSYKLDVGALATYVAGIVTSSIDVGSLSSATLSDGDLFLVDEGATNTKVTLANLRSHFWSEFTTYVGGLTGAVSAANANLLYLVSSGSPLKITIGDLWTTRYLLDAKAIKLDDFATPDDNTDLNASITRHGLLPKLSNNTRQFFRGDGTYTTYASVTATPVSATGSIAGDAAALAATNTTFITSDSAAKGVKLPTGAAGDIMEVINNSTTAAKLYPATGGFLNGQAVDAAVVIPASKGVRCFCTAADTWTVFEMAAKAANA
jgi:hypothetical protein